MLKFWADRKTLSKVMGAEAQIFVKLWRFSKKKHKCQIYSIVGLQTRGGGCDGRLVLYVGEPLERRKMSQRLCQICHSGSPDVPSYLHGYRKPPRSGHI